MHGSHAALPPWLLTISQEAQGACSSGPGQPTLSAAEPCLARCGELTPALQLSLAAMRWAYGSLRVWVGGPWMAVNAVMRWKKKASPWPLAASPPLAAPAVGGALVYTSPVSKGRQGSRPRRAPASDRDWSRTRAAPPASLPPPHLSTLWLRGLRRSFCQRSKIIDLYCRGWGG